ncbi:hypothetical protein EV421DRAFT_1852869 [Armillaria borealis]|uniref:Uncharacterized protein n=1 Tax=Armillaria borealis TaxID=47425 RepID=A0AA39MFB7_9AGAR|nr:hypothetical protein EV421DRAFT_1852869 [Armillaria borealis]
MSSPEIEVYRRYPVARPGYLPDVLPPIFSEPGSLPSGIRQWAIKEFSIFLNARDRSFTEVDTLTLNSQCWLFCRTKEGSHEPIFSQSVHHVDEEQKQRASNELETNDLDFSIVSKHQPEFPTIRIVFWTLGDKKSFLHCYIHIGAMTSNIIIPRILFKAGKRLYPSTGMTNTEKAFFQIATDVINKASGTGAYELAHLVRWDDVPSKDDAEQVRWLFKHNPPVFIVVPGDTHTQFSFSSTDIVYHDDNLDCIKKLCTPLERFPLHRSLDNLSYHQSLNNVQGLPDRVMSSLPVYGSHTRTLAFDESEGTQTICIPLEMLRLYAAIDSVQTSSDEARHSALCLKATMRLTLQHEFSHYIVTNVHKFKNTPPRKSLTWATDDIYDTAVFEIQGGDGPLDSGFLTEIRLTRGRTELVRTQAGWLQLGRVVPSKIVERHVWELNPHLRKSTSTPENNQVNQEDQESNSEVDPDHESDGEVDFDHTNVQNSPLLQSMFVRQADAPDPSPEPENSTNHEIDLLHRPVILALVSHEDVKKYAEGIFDSKQANSPELPVADLSTKAHVLLRSPLRTPWQRTYMQEMDDPVKRLTTGTVVKDENSQPKPTSPLGRGPRVLELEMRLANTVWIDRSEIERKRDVF